MFLGTQYYRPPNPPQRDWERDLALIKDTGLDLVRTWLYWARVNPRPGQWVWEDYDRFMDLADRHGLKALIQLMMDGTPYWFQDRHPEALFVDASGHPVSFRARGALAIGGVPGPCFDNPTARELAGEFVTRAVERYAGHPALHSWDVWNEIWPFPMLMQNYGLQACYCPSSQEAFRAWLRGKYGDISQLNERWQRSYAGFEEVAEPAAGQYADMLDLWGFGQERTAEWMRWRTGLVRAKDPAHLIVSHECRASAIDSSSEDDWLIAESLDVWGVSHYRTDYHELSFLFDATRGAAGGKPWWLSELSGGRGVGSGRYFYLSDGVKSPAEMRSMPLLAYSHGAEGVVFWQWRCERFGEEAPNFGIVNQAGERTERSESLKGLARMLHEHAATLDRLDFGPARVAILWEPRSYQLERLTYWDRGEDPLGPVELAGYHRALSREGLQVDILNARLVAQRGVPESLRLLVMPYQTIDRPGLAERIAAWVERGGTLVAGPVVGQYEETTYASEQVPPPHWRDLLGVRQRELRYPESPALDLVHPVLGAGQRRLTGYKLIETYELLGAEPLATWQNEVAGAHRAFGKGRVVVLGTFAGYTAAKGADDSLGLLLHQVLAEAGVQAALRATGGAMVRTARAGEGWMAFVHNPAHTSAMAWLSPASRDVEGAARDLMSGEELGELAYGRPLCLSIPARDTTVLFIR